MRRSLKHDHMWVEVTRRWTPGVALDNGKGNPQALQRLIFGFTTIELRCASCGDLSFTEQPGDQR